MMIMLFIFCAKEDEKKIRNVEMSINQENWGKTSDGKDVQLYTLVNKNGLEVKITNYGGIVVSLRVPDRNGNLDDIVLGYDTLDEYISNNPYFGALIGRYGNRIAKGTFVLEGKEYRLAKNNGENHLHGGIKGFDKVVWDAEPLRQTVAVGVKLEYLSKDGEEGYPGNLFCSVTYLLTNENELVMRYSATSDKSTVVNLTHHSYFNLAGQGKSDILAHELQILADRFTPVDEGLIPTGELRPVENTPMDFREPKPIGANIDDEDEQLSYGGGYDFNWVLNNQDDDLALAARVYEPTSGRVMDILTTEPGIQFYSGNFLDGTIIGKEGRKYNHRYGFCLETQHYPDSPNKPNFPSVILYPGSTYSHETVHTFYVR